MGKSITKLRMLQKKTDKNLKKIDDLLDTLRAFKEVAVKIKDKELYEFINLDQFCLLFHKDIDLLIYNILSTQDMEAKKLYSRLLALLVYEHLKTLKKLLGKEKLHRVIKTLNLDESRLTSFYNLKNALTTLWDKHGSCLGVIRHNVIGHRDQSAEVQIKLLSKIDPIIIVPIGQEIYLWQNSFLKFWTDIIKNWKALRYPDKE